MWKLETANRETVIFPHYFIKILQIYLSYILNNVSDYIRSGFRVYIIIGKIRTAALYDTY